MGLAVQAPIMRLTAAQAVELLPVLRRAALDLVDPDEQPAKGARTRRRQGDDPADERLSA
jgi:hypothetical protein